MAIELTPLTEWIGARVSGVTPGALTADDRGLLNDALDTCHVLVVRETPMSEDEQIDFATSFGPIQMSSAPPSPLRNAPRRSWSFRTSATDGGVALGTLPDGEMDWHYDGLHQKNPYRGGILHALEVPPSGGETRFANMCRVYSSLPEATRAKLIGLTAVNVYDYAATSADVKVRDPGAPRATHPVVRFHEASAEGALYVCRLMTERILELDEAESAELLEELFAAIDRSTDLYEHSWRPGDTVIWDNRCVTHARNDFDSKQRRYLKRVSVAS